MNRRAWVRILIASGALLMLLALVDSLWQPAPTAPDRPGIGIEAIYPAGTPTPAGYRPGLACVRCKFSNAGATITPAPGQVGAHVEIYWDDVPPDLTAGWKLLARRCLH